MASSARIDELLKKFDENPRRYFAPLANEYRKSGDLDRAIQICREHLPQQPGHMSGHIVFGQALFEAQQFDEARTVFEAALALDPENLIALRHLGDIARDHGDVAGARDWYQRVLDADPRNEEISAQIAALDAAGAPAAAASPSTLEAHAPSVEAGPTFDITLPMEPAAAAHGAAHDAAHDAQPAPSTDASRTVGSEASDIPPLDLEPSAFDGRSDAEHAPASAADTPAADLPALDLDDDFFGARASSSAERESESAAVSAAASGSAGADVAAGGDLDLELSDLHAELGRSSPTGAAEGPFDSDRLELEPDDAGADSLSLSGASDTTRMEEFRGAESSGPELDLYIPEPEPEREHEPASASAASETRPAAEAASTGESQADAAYGAPDAATVEEAPHAVTPPASVLGLESMEFVGPPRGVAAPELDETERDPLMGHTVRDVDTPSATPAAFVTETMAELYLQQGFRDEALGVYRQLLAQNPTDESLRERVSQLESGRASSVSVAEVSETVIEAAQKRRDEQGPLGSAPAAASGGPNVRAFFASLAARRPATPVDFASIGTPPAGAVAMATPSTGGAASRRYDDFGFPVDGDTAASEDQGTYASDTALSEDTLGAELVGPGAVEPATLDYLANDLPTGEPSGDAGYDRGVVSDGAAEQRHGDAFGRAGDASATGTPGNGTPRAARTVTGPVDSLFGGDVARQDESAAATLADAFGDAEPGQPQRAPTPASASRSATPPTGAGGGTQGGTRPAASELSLDHVFRDTPRRSPGQRRQTPSFSFDQFFAEAAPPREEVGQGDASSAPRATDDAEKGAQPQPTTDIEQFNAWLEGLKKK